ncbi:MAG: putative baseplate assembly protein [Pseudomonadota bacterium]
MSGSLNKPTPVTVENRAGLPAIRTRVGTHSTFLDAMLRGLADANRPGLSELRTREAGDFSLGLLDAWAGVCDTLTFYQERHSNEAYLRTATERESIRAHARLVGYELAPAKAAGTFLAFEAEEVDAPDDALQYGPGLQVRSVPRDDELPQIFETIEPLTARGDWNAMRPRMAYPQILTADDDEISLTPDAPRLIKGDPILFIQGKAPVAFTNADRPGFLRRVTDLSDGLGGRKIGSLAANPTGPAPYIFEIATEFLAWPATLTLSTNSLASTVPAASWSVGAFSTAIAYNSVSLFTLNAAITALTITAEDPILPFVMRVRAGFFGNTAISKRASPVEASDQTVSAVSYTTSAPSGLDDTHQEVSDAAHPSGRYYVYLDREYPEITPGQVLLVRDAANEAFVEIHAAEAQSVEGYSMSAKVTRLEVDNVGRTPSGGTRNLNLFNTRTAVAYTVAEPLPLSDLPITRPVGETLGDLRTDQLELDSPELQLLPGKSVAITGALQELSGVAGAEIRTIKENTLNDGFSVLTFTQPLSQTYVRDSVRINANVAEATHGETVEEILGDGDATLPFQTFKLKSTPLTHVSARTTSGMAPALEVRVDNVCWDLVEDFRDAGPEDQVYLLRIEEDGTTFIILGDGITGQRAATGQDNVTALYRKGAGLNGHLDAGQLSLLATKPVGLKGVTNPLVSSGAADAEALEDARQNAPLKVLTLGRVVSLRDYEDFARGFAAVAKARADWTFDGFARPIFLTVAGQDGAILAETGKDMTNLRAALLAAGEADQRVSVFNHRPASFAVAAQLYLDPAYIPDDVLEAARRQLELDFCFQARGLGQAVSHAQIIASLQSVPGTRGVDLNALYRVGEAEERRNRLVASVARPDLSGAIPEPAELLIIDPAAITLEPAS